MKKKAFEIHLEKWLIESMHIMGMNSWSWDILAFHVTAKLDLEGAENKCQSFKVSGTVLFHWLLILGERMFYLNSSTQFVNNTTFFCNSNTSPLNCCNSPVWNTLDSGINVAHGITVAPPLKNFHIMILILFYINLGIAVIF